MLKLLIQGIAVFVMSLALGGIGVYLYSYFSQDRSVEGKTVTIDLLRKDNGLVEEVFDTEGLLMDQLAYSFDKSSQREQAVEVLKQAGISAEIHDSRIMVQSGKSGLALDLLSLKGYIPGIENFSFTDVTADEGSLRHRIQNRIATQNMLANMVETMTAGVEAARVYLDSKSVNGDIDDIRVLILRKDGVNGLNLSDLEGIRSNIVAMTGVEDSSIIDIVDSKTGKSY